METRSYTLNLLTIIIQLVYTGQILLYWYSVNISSYLHTAKSDTEFQTGVITAIILYMPSHHSGCNFPCKRCPRGASMRTSFGRAGMAIISEVWCLLCLRARSDPGRPVRPSSGQDGTDYGP